MAVDVAELGVKVDATEVKKADGVLDNFAKTAEKAEKATDKLNDSQKEGKKATDIFKDAVGGSSGVLKQLIGVAAGAAAAVGAYLLASANIHKFIDATAQAQSVQMQLAAALMSTGGASGQTISSLNDQSEALQKISVYGSEAIGTAQSILLTFTRIGKETFPQATTAAANLAARLGTDLSSAALQIGKALNDPIAGLSSLGRAGVQFSESQRTMIKSMVDANNVAGAQAIILKQLEIQFGGSAQAARDTLGGALAALANAFGDLYVISGAGAERFRTAIEGLIAVLKDPAVVAFAQTVGNALFTAMALATDAIGLFVRALVGLFDFLPSLIPLILAVFGPATLTMIMNLTIVGIGGLTVALTALWGLIAANPLVSVTSALVVILGYMVDWQSSVSGLIKLWGDLIYTVGQALEAMGLGGKGLMDKGFQIVINADKAAADLMGAAETFKQKTMEGFHQGGDPIPPNLQKALENGGKSAAMSLADAQSAAMARYEALNGKAVQALGDTMVDGGKYIYNQVTGSMTKGAGDVGKSIAASGTQAGDAIGNSMVSAGQKVGTTVYSSLESAFASLAPLIDVFTQASLRFMAENNKIIAEASKARAEARATLAGIDSHHPNGSGGSGSGSTNYSSSGNATGSFSGDIRSFSVGGPTGISFGKTLQSMGPSLIPRSDAFATGGEFTVGGNGGVDSTPVSFMATPGERVSVGHQNASDKPQSPPPVKIVNILSADEVLSAMATAAGERLIINHIKTNPAKYRAILGV
jgi:hypothetical protein